MTPIPTNDVQLIAYANRLGGTIPALHRLLEGRFAGLFGGVHLLPFFAPFDGADAGFDPIDHTRVDKRLGTWDDVRALARDRILMADFIVNHVSINSTEFRDVLARGDASPYRPMFLLFEDIYPEGADAAELAGIFRPRPGMCFTPMHLGGTTRLVWTTFTHSQVDIDIRTPQGRGYLERVFHTLVAGGVRMIRLDAVGYAVKTPGTSSFLTEDTHRLIDAITERAHACGIRILVELRGYHRQQIEVARRVDLVYDFALPALVLHALFTADPGPLLRWFGIRPTNCVTVLDTHDGIGVVDVAPLREDPEGSPGLLTEAEILALVRRIHANTRGESAKASRFAAGVADLYQVNSTFHDALGGRDELTLLARAIQLFTPGTPQVYYVGLLAGANDTERVGATGSGREINRHPYSDAEVDAALARPVVRAILGLIRIRNEHPAFAGSFHPASDGSVLVLHREHEGAAATLRADLETGAASLTLRDADGAEVVHPDLLSCGAG